MRHLELETSKRFSVIGLGTRHDHDERRTGRLVARARELGVTVFGTAGTHGLGRGERILGAALRDCGGTDDVVVATTILPVLPTAAGVHQLGVASARRLGVRRLDLCQVHQPNPLVGDATTMRGMRTLREAGVVEEVGVSNHPLRRWRRAEAALGTRILANRVPFSLLAPAPRDGLVPWARRTGHVVLAADPLAGGELSGRPGAGGPRPGGRRAANALFLPASPRAAGPLPGLLREIATAHGATPAQIALAWVVHHPGVVAVPGASSVEQVEQNAAAADIRLTDTEHAALTAAAEALRPRVGFSALPGLVRGRR
ncbi:MAG TPA: aldo/keto reductase [Pseudonocardia sp.]|nr:aldo/keto reductase [Pseudonocardia sp.]